MKDGDNCVIVFVFFTKYYKQVINEIKDFLDGRKRERKVFYVTALSVANIL